MTRRQGVGEDGNGLGLELEVEVGLELGRGMHLDDLPLLFGLFPRRFLLSPFALGFRLELRLFLCQRHLSLHVVPGFCGLLRRKSRFLGRLLHRGFVIDDLLPSIPGSGQGRLVSGLFRGQGASRCG